VHRQEVDSTPCGASTAQSAIDISPICGPHTSKVSEPSAISQISDVMSDPEAFLSYLR